MEEITLLPYQYPQILENVRNILAQAKLSAQTAVAHIIADSYWRIGQAIHIAHLTDEDLLNTMTRLSKDIEIERTQIQRCLKFYTLWPYKSPTDLFSNLTWSHYKIFLSLNNELERNFYIDAAQRNKWPVRILSQKVKEDLFSRVQTTDPNIINPETILKRRSNALHVYKSTLNYVVDGDTLVINIDLGFDVWVKKRLRLRGINSPELKSPNPSEAAQAKEAKAFVQGQIKPGETIVIQTFAVDLHGRFVADVFYLPGETDKENIFKNGVFLNQKLLDGGFATLA